MPCPTWGFRPGSSGLRCRCSRTSTALRWETVPGGRWGSRSSTWTSQAQRAARTASRQTLPCASSAANPEKRRAPNQPPTGSHPCRALKWPQWWCRRRRTVMKSSLPKRSTAAVQVMRQLCRTTDGDVAAPCVLLLDQGHRAIDSGTQRSAPTCRNSHVMKMSAGGNHTSGCVCTGCQGRSSASHNRSSRERWFCSRFNEDICLGCHPKPAATVNATPSVLQAAAVRDQTQMIEVFLDEAFDVCKQAVFPGKPESSPIVQACEAGAEAAAVLLLDRCARHTGT